MFSKWFGYKHPHQGERERERICCTQLVHSYYKVLSSWSVTSTLIVTNNHYWNYVSLKFTSPKSGLSGNYFSQILGLCRSVFEGRTMKNVEPTYSQSQYFPWPKKRHKSLTQREREREREREVQADELKDISD